MDGRRAGTGAERGQVGQSTCVREPVGWRGGQDMKG